MNFNVKTKENKRVEFDLLECMSIRTQFKKEILESERRIKQKVRDVYRINPNYPITYLEEVKEEAIRENIVDTTRMKDNLKNIVSAITENFNPIDSTYLSTVNRSKKHGKTRIEINKALDYTDKLNRSNEYVKSILEGVEFNGLEINSEPEILESSKRDNMINMLNTLTNIKDEVTLEDCNNFIDKINEPEKLISTFEALLETYKLYSKFGNYNTILEEDLL